MFLLCVCVCVRACVRVRVRARARVCVCARARVRVRVRVCVCFPSGKFPSSRKSTNTQAAWHWRGPHLLNVVVLAVADGLFGLYGSECADELFISTQPLPFPRPY